MNPTPEDDFLVKMIRDRDVTLAASLIGLDSRLAATLRLVVKLAEVSGITTLDGKPVLEWYQDARTERTLKSLLFYEEMWGTDGAMKVKAEMSKNGDVFNRPPLTKLE